MRRSALVAPLVAALLPATAHAVPATDVTQAATWRIVGGAQGWQIGSIQEAAGDVNGDGRDDVVLSGYRYADQGEQSRAWVVFGQPAGAGAPTTIDLSALGTRGFAIDGEPQNAFTGNRVDGAGDVNGDGRDDVVLSAMHERGDLSRVLDAYVVYGKTSTSTTDLTTLSQTGAGFRIGYDTPTTAIPSGTTMQVSGAGDFDGDGDGDLAIATQQVKPGQSYFLQSMWVVPGKPSQPDLDLAARTATTRALEVVLPNLLYLRADSSICDTLEEVGDVAGTTGRDDVLIACRNGSQPIRSTFTSRANVVFGRSPVSGRINLTGTLAVTGIQGKEDFGTAAGLGDTNGDGRADFALGSPGTGTDPNHPQGRVLVVYGRGPATTLRSSSLGTRGIVIDGAEPDDSLGVGIAGVGNVTGDARADLVLSAGDPLPAGPGELWQLPGRQATGRTTVAAVPGAKRLDATATDPLYVSKPSALGDFDGDGRRDLLVNSIHLSQEAPNTLLIVPLPLG